MSTKELIQKELDALDDEDLDVLYAVIKQLARSNKVRSPAV